MIRLAIADCETLEVSDIEIKREGTTYTIDTLKQLRENLNAQTMCLILGLDVFQGMDTWKDWREIPGYAHLIIANRPGERKGFRNDEIRSFFESRLANSVSELHEYSEGKLISLDVPMLDISSSRIRSLLQAGQSARYLLPDPVLDYIVKNETYIKQD
jgi:nicotinate-nucleotide adenylyltransferase